jgi:hypothetical protein
VKSDVKKNTIPSVTQQVTIFELDRKLSIKEMVALLNFGI